MWKLSSWMVAIGLVTAWAAPVSAANAGDGEYDRVYELRHLDARVAESWIWDLCESTAPDELCRVRGVEPEGLVVLGDDRLHAAVTRLLVERDVDPRPTQAFQVVLVRAASDGDGVDRRIPEDARRALEDVADLLPFTRFELVDAGWIETARRGEMRLRDDLTDYQVVVDYRARHGLDEVELAIERFQVFPLVLGSRRQGRVDSEASPSPASAPEPSTPQAPAIAPSGGEPPMPEARAARLAAMAGREAPLPGPRVVPTISTSLAMTPGETVVVGTSRAGVGDSVLIAVLTARP